MNILILTLVILLCLNQNVTGHPLFDLLAAKLNDFASTVTKTFHHIRLEVRKLFQPPHTYEQLPSASLQYGDSIFKRTFNDFVEMTAAENETEIPEYINLKSEPTALMSTPQLATLHGRRVESHLVHTRDGYMLTLHRISPRTDRTPAMRVVNQTVLLHHGLLGSSADWILLGPEKSLPYILTDFGYDVWMANARGNYYSRGHIRMSVDSEEFWKFSFHEIGEYDLPAVVDYIRYVKKSNDPIDFVGHSMGATALLVMLSTLPEYNQYLRIGILLAPLAFMSNVEGPFKVLTAMANSPPAQLLKLIGNKEFVPTRKIPKWLALKYCKGPLLFCCNPLYFISGGIPEDNHAWNLSFLARMLYHVPAGGSTDTMLHYAQIVKSGKFHKYNKVHEEYSLNKISLPIVLFSSSEDWLATIPDVLRLYFSITNPIDHYIIRGRNMSHTEFVWGAHADELVFTKIIEFLDSGIRVLGSTKSNEVRNDLD
ncbi:lipase 3-like [Helicoverpa zea]|uniref:lipase 3-like n=1 Tax=Helicoverpa zea TaxID=7113 RepID=UPI001F55BF73|nr:lipase 3-like [Helicoverpa zea]